MRERIPECVPKFFSSYQSFIILGHKEPDMDCIGSQLALTSFLRNSGKHCTAINAGPFRRRETQIYAELFTTDIPDIATKSPSETGVIILDCSVISRIGENLAQKASPFPYLIIDHHTGHETGEGTEHYIDPSASSTALLIYRIAKSLDYKITRETAVLLFKALATDTGFFRFLSEKSSESFNMAAELTDLGASPRSISEDLEGHNSFASRKILARAIENTQALAGGKYLISTLSNKELEDFGNEKDSDSLYSMLLNTQDCQAIAVICEDETGNCKVSLRSKSTVNVASIARNFSGGGHKQAAGFYVSMSLKQVVKTLKHQFIALDSS